MINAENTHGIDVIYEQNRCFSIKHAQKHGKNHMFCGCLGLETDKNRPNMRENSGFGLKNTAKTGQKSMKNAMFSGQKLQKHGIFDMCLGGESAKNAGFSRVPAPFRYSLEWVPSGV